MRAGTSGWSILLPLFVLDRLTNLGICFISCFMAPPQYALAVHKTNGRGDRLSEVLLV
jgi:hypothetical protein